MKIFILNQHPQDVIGGSEVQCDLRAKTLVKFGHQVIYGAVGSQAESYDTEYIVEPITKNFYSDYVKLLRKYRPDIVYWQFNKKKLFLSALIARLMNVKFVFSTAHIRDIKQLDPIMPNFSGDFISSSLSIVLIIFKNIRNWFNFFGHYFETAVVSNNADQLNKLPAKKQLTVHDGFISPDVQPFIWPRPYVVWIANIKARKQPEMYVKLAQELKDLNVDFLVVGNIQDSEYKYFEQPDKLPANVKYLGPKSLLEIHSLLRGSELFVHTCEPEGFGDVFILAWLNSKPVVSLAFDPESMIESNGIGFYSRNFEQFVKDVSTLLKDHDLRKAMGLKGKQFAQENFDLDKNVRKLESFLQSL